MEVKRTSGGIAVRLETEEVISCPAPTFEDPHPWHWMLVATFVPAARSVPLEEGEERDAAIDEVAQLFSVALSKIPSEPCDEDAWWTLLLTYADRELERVPVVPILPGRPARRSKRAQAILRLRYPRHVFRYGGQIALYKHGELKIADTPKKLKNVFADAVRFEHPKQREGFADDDLLHYALANIDPKLPELRGITSLPILTAEGVITTPGYHAPSRLIYNGSQLVDVENPLSIIWEPFREFAFANEHAKTGTLAAVFTPLLLPLFESARPMFIFDAPPTHGSGTGKSLLGAVCSHLVNGGQWEMGWKPLPRSEAEISKTITGIFRDQALPVMGWQNVRRSRLASESLDVVCTQAVWSSRILGQSTTLSVPNHTTWYLTTNGLTINEDLSRRMVFVELQAAKPNRDFRRELPAWIPKIRLAYLSAAYALIEEWLRDQPASQIRLAGFEGWARVVGSFVPWLCSRLGIAGDLAHCLAVAKSRDEEAQARDALVRAWWETRGANQCLVASFLDSPLEDLCYEAFPGLEAARDDKGKIRRLAWCLKRLNGSVVGGIRIRYATKAHDGKSAMVWLEVLDG